MNLLPGWPHEDHHLYSEEFLEGSGDSECVQVCQEIYVDFKRSAVQYCRWYSRYLLAYAKRQAQILAVEIRHTTTHFLNWRYRAQSNRTSVHLPVLDSKYIRGTTPQTQL